MLWGENTPSSYVGGAIYKFSSAVTHTEINLKKTIPVKSMVSYCIYGAEIERKLYNIVLSMYKANNRWR